MHKIKFLLLTFFSVLTVLSYSNNEIPSGIVTPSEYACSLPAPSGLQVTNVTTNSISVQWLPVSGAIAYKVSVFDSITNAPVIAPIITVNTYATASGLSPGHAYRIEVAAICSNWQVSPNTSVIYERTDIVIEIIANGFNCHPPSSGWHDHTFTGTPFSEYFDMTTVYIIEITKTVGNNSSTSNFEFRSFTDNAQIHNVEINSGSVKYIGTEVKFEIAANSYLFTLTIESVSNNLGKLHFRNTAVDSNYTLRFAACAQGQDMKKQLEVRSDQTTESIPLTVVPNPFSGYLEVQFPDDEEDSPATVQLFHTSGALALSQKMASARGKTLTMNTSGLPAGMYLLRTETLTGVTTKLVMKTE